MGKINIDDHKVINSDLYFFDTNIWLLLFGTIADFQKNQQKKYSEFFAEVLGKEIPIYITSLVFSEFSNVLLRRDFNRWQKTNSFIEKDFKKDFVGTDEYKNSVNLIKIQLNKILSLPNLMRIGDSFHIIDFDDILQNFELIDFNDCYYAEICKSFNYILVTNDKDLFILKEKIDLLTAL